ncbi:hypothetical protein [Streptococcus iniae]|uniref:hypothetical protein n=2 Tax=Streptococcus iniae TaxID=1346 RepID=UPI00115D141B|nr:hypothetical protein [Streptococcus iniae]
MLPNQILGPMLVESKEVAEDLGLRKETLRTHSKAGVKYLVAFIPIEAEEYAQTEKIYNHAVNSYLKPFRRSRSKNPIEVTSYEDWVVSDDHMEQGSTQELDEFLLSEMLDELLEKVNQLNPKLGRTLLALIENDGERSLADAFKQKNISRSTGFHHLPAVRKLVEELLHEVH